MDDGYRSRDLLQGVLWIVGGLVAGAFRSIFSSRDDLLVLVAGLYLFSIVAVGVATFDVQRALGQLAMAAGLLLAIAAVWVNFSINPVIAVMLWLAVVAGSANAFSRHRLSLLTLLGQLIPVTIVAFEAVMRYEVPVKEVAVAYFVSLGLCLLGPLVNRAVPRDIDLAGLDATSRAKKNTSFSGSENGKLNI